MGYWDGPHGHAEVRFTDVAVDGKDPSVGVVLGAGRGFEIAQGRLGPGRLHHCARLIGMADRALSLAADRARRRHAFGGPLKQQGSLREALARRRIALEGARLLVLRAASVIDGGVGGATVASTRAARFVVAEAKVATPEAALAAIDFAMQIHGGAGVSGDVPLAWLWAQARTLRIADGPDEVHLSTLAKRELSTPVTRARM
jgi:acyl-CoA dehydrogenase